MNAKLVKVVKRIAPYATGISATILVMNHIKSGLDENSNEFEIRATRATAAFAGVITFGIVAALTQDVLEDLTTDEVAVVVKDLADEIKE